MIPDINWDPNNVCTCKLSLLEMEEQCYKDEVMYVLQTPEESGTDFGYGTRTVHAKCDRPVWPTVEEFRAQLKIAPKRVFFNK